VTKCDKISTNLYPFSWIFPVPNYISLIFTLAWLFCKSYSELSSWAQRRILGVSYNTQDSSLHFIPFRMTYLKSSWAQRRILYIPLIILRRQPKDLRCIIQHTRFFIPFRMTYPQTSKNPPKKCYIYNKVKIDNKNLTFYHSPTTKSQNRHKKFTNIVNFTKIVNFRQHFFICHSERSEES